MVSDAPRDASDNTLLFHRLADLIQRRRIINGRQISRIASFANRLDRAAQHFSGSRFWQLRDKPDVRRAAKVANLAVHQRHNRLLLRMRHITIFQTVALFRNDKRHRHLPFQRIFHPNHRHFGNARMAGDTLFNLARPQPMPGNVNYIVSAPENKVITVSVTDAPVKGGVHRAENSDQ